MRAKKINSLEMQVMKNPCKTCPFEGTEPVDLDPKALERYKHSIMNFQAQHLCHSVNNKKFCRGGRNILLQILYRLHYIKEPTDKCFIQTMKEVLGK